MSGGKPAGSSRALRLDPHTLPVTFAAPDAHADGRCREVELTRERVVVRRSLGGMKMAMNLPVTAFRGVALRMITDENYEPAGAIVLAHTDPGLDLELCVTDQPDEIVQAWYDWALALGVPLLPAEQDNNPPVRPQASVDVDAPFLRRRRRNAIKARRASILMRRQVTRVGECGRYGGEREIIARD